MTAERIQKGVSLLDSKVPNWREQINLNDFCFWSPFSCVLGQLFGYTYGLAFLGIVGKATEYGFQHGYSESWQEIEALWIEEIQDEFEEDDEILKYEFELLEERQNGLD